jgi:hypothetical protein
MDCWEACLEGGGVRVGAQDRIFPRNDADRVSLGAKAWRMFNRGSE